MISNIQQLLNQITPDIYRRLIQATELGKWPTGERLSTKQRELCMQAVIAYEQKHLAPEQRTGYIPPKEHNHCGNVRGAIAETHPELSNQEQPLTFKQ